MRKGHRSKLAGDVEAMSDADWDFFRYDKLAFRYVSYVAVPLLAAYSVYSLVYETHRGWYSYIISTLTSFVYMFGFVSILDYLVHVVKGLLSLTINFSRHNWYHNLSLIIN